MKTTTWKDFNPYVICRCEDSTPTKLVDDIDGSWFWVCSTCHCEVMPCKYCASTPCKCVEINNQVDEARGN